MADLKETSVAWELLQEVFHPDEAQLICGLLQMANIPYKVDRESAGELYGLTVGPLARIAIYVPIDQLEAAQKISGGVYDVSNGDVEDSEEP